MVSDLHLEKGSSFAARGVLLPPYDSAATLARLAAAIARCNPRRVMALGDSFHDRDAHDVIGKHRSRGNRCAAGRPRLDLDRRQSRSGAAADLGGAVLDELRLGPIVFRHEPTGARGEIAGHLHPKARVPTRGHSVERRCFACDGERVVMPAFGAYAGGLSIRDRAFAAIFRSLEFTAHVLGDAPAACDCGVALLLNSLPQIFWSFRGVAMRRTGSRNCRGLHLRDRIAADAASGMTGCYAAFA